MWLWRSAALWSYDRATASEECDHQQHDGHDREEPPDLGGEAGYAPESQSRGDQRNDEKYQCIV